MATRPRRTGASLGRYYEERGEQRLIDAERFYCRPLGRAVLAGRVRSVTRHRALGPGDRLLDVGCSTGFFLRAARQATGCATSGVDIDAAKLARALDARLAHALAAVGPFLAWWTVELPVQALLWAVGRSGHQGMVGRRTVGSGLMDQATGADHQGA